jgi:ABC-2 type transport system permease protein
MPSVSQYKSKASGEKSVKGLNEIKIAIGGGFEYLDHVNYCGGECDRRKTNRIIEIIIGEAISVDDW